MTAAVLLQLRVLRFGFFQDGDVGIGCRRFHSITSRYGKVFAKACFTYPLPFPLRYYGACSRPIQSILPAA
jgi:hypothetical protein